MLLVTCRLSLLLLVRWLMVLTGFCPIADVSTSSICSGFPVNVPTRFSPFPPPSVFLVVDGCVRRLVLNISVN